MWKSTNQIMNNIRNLEENDWEQFLVLELDTFQNDPTEKASFLRLLKNDGFFGLFNPDNVLIGYLYCHVYGVYAHLHRIGILSTEQGKGYGSILFEKAIQYFEERDVPHFNLYVETHNSPAIALYEKYGLKKMFESWHFIIDLDQHKKFVKEYISDITVKNLTIADLPAVQNIFKIVNLDELKGMLQDLGSNRFLIMFQNGNVKAVARFNKKFSGCRPFLISDITYFDTFLNELLKIREPDKEYIRITFDDNDDLAKLCKERGYKIHHHLYKMTRI